MTELEPELNADEYAERRDELARHTLAMRVSEEMDYTDVWEVYENILMGFYEDYPVSVIEHASVDPTGKTVLGLIEGRPVKNPLEELVDHAHAVLANDLTQYIEKTLIAETEIIEVDPNVADPAQAASLTEQGEKFL
ncbi:hypothetical protein [Halobacteriaceae bacterium SHR40]|uniref:hypothetical protein n=1 Tax=Halovenus amylolytica TaxID=2500550 RepID=UPI000FE3CE69